MISMATDNILREFLEDKFTYRSGNMDNLTLEDIINEIARKTSQKAVAIHKKYHSWEMPIRYELPQFPAMQYYTKGESESYSILKPFNCTNPLNQTVTYLFSDIRFYVYVVTIGLLCLFGIIFNIISVIVITKDHKTTINFFLKSLAISDILSLGMMLFHHTFSSFYPHTGLLEEYYRKSVYMIPYIWPLRMTVNTVGMLVITAITIDRYIRVCHPTKVQTLGKLVHAYISMAVIVFIAVIINIPRFFVIKTSSVYHRCTGDMFVFNELTDFYKDNFALIYSLDSIGYFVPFIAMVVFNSILLFTVHKSRKKQSVKRNGSFSGRIAFNVTATLITIVVVFIVCETPIRIYRLLIFVKSFAHQGTAERFNEDEKGAYCIQLLGDTLTTFDCFVNLFVFTFVGQRFRKILLHMVLCRRGNWQTYNSIPQKSKTISLKENEKKSSFKEGGKFLSPNNRVKKTPETSFLTA